MPALPAIDHLALTVSDVEVSVLFYSRLLGAEPSGTMLDGPFIRRKFDLGGGASLGLTEHQAATGENRFDEHHPGLDHVGFSVASSAELLQWAAHLDSIGVVHSGLIDAPYGTALNFKDPDGIALEFFVSQ
ncbi:VOC family protein [Paeniglutamicibacter cryotolerans]|uniref:Catechol-2,3-dioxygenase n=1 Tax=Paeniglutamicibacter cryotolerans TaxID=670079 RepID=A0A839QP88_9MICC|nr:VOC family protein [Paeniglutamicibacter cryotolerans]MBB2997570.1 catechol-2,3-dioxygenase [Paeniglutamicibacter cryotolerans]